jgi:hypothetical protein
MYRRQDKKNYYINVANKSFGNVAKFKLLRKKINYPHQRGKESSKVEGRKEEQINMEECLLSFGLQFFVFQSTSRKQKMQFIYIYIYIYIVYLATPFQLLRLYTVE